MNAPTVSTLEQATQKLSKKLRRWPWLVVFITLPSLILLISGLLVWGLNQRPAVEGEISRWVDSVWYFAGESVQVNLAPDDYDSMVLEGQTEASIATADILFVLDVSGSMGAQETLDSPLRNATDIIRQISDILQASGINIGLIKFDGSANLSAALGSTHSQVRQALNQKAGGGGTDIGAAIEMSLTELNTNAVSKKKLVIILSDGGDDVQRTKTLAKQAQQDNIFLAGIGIGDYANDFFKEAFALGQQSPHFSMQWDNNPEQLFNLFMRDILFDSRLAVLESSGKGVKLIDYPHFNAMPIFAAETRDIEADEMGITPIDLTVDSIIFRLFYFLDNPHYYSYVLQADAWGVHTVALAPAKLTYTDSHSGEAKTLISGMSPTILVLTPWMLLMYLPALFYLLFMLLGRRAVITLMQPSDLPQLMQPLPLPDLPMSQFKYRSMVLQSLDQLDGVLPTMVIAIGAGAGQKLAALIHARREVGASDYGPNTSFYPLCVDCHDYRDDNWPAYLDVKLDKSALLTLGNTDDSGASLAALIREVREQQGKHPAASWFDAGKYIDRVPDIASGCAGDRQLARFLLYRDLLNEKPLLHQLRDDVNRWCDQNNNGQIFIIASGYEDMGSGWMVDIAFQIRTALQTKAVPLYLFLDSGGQASPELQNNFRALSTELETLQNAAGWPYSSMDRVAQKVHCDNSILLPLFDRVIQLQHNHEDAEPALAAASMLELMDIESSKKIEHSLADNAWKYRNGYYRATAKEKRQKSSGFITVLDTAVFYLPLRVWQGIWSQQVLRDMLQALIKFNISDGKVQFDEPLLGDSDRLRIWTDMVNIKTAAEVESLNLWASINEGNITAPSSIAINTSTFSNELLALVVRYLNASPSPGLEKNHQDCMQVRSGRFNNALLLLQGWQHYLTATVGADGIEDSLLQGPLAAVSLVNEQLASWQSALIVADERRPKDLLQQISSEQAILQQQLPVNSSETGRVSLSVDQWSENPEGLYHHSINQQLIQSGVIPCRLQWDLGADGKKIQLLLQGEQTHRYDVDDIANGKLQLDIVTLLHHVFLASVFNWNLDTCLNQSVQADFLRLTPVKNEARTFLFHGYESEKNNKAIQGLSAFSSSIVSRHSYKDRIVFMSIDENRASSLDSELMSTASDLPFIQEYSKNLTILLGQYRSHSGGNISQLSPPDKLLAQQMQNLDLSLKALLSGLLEQTGSGDLLQWSLKNGSLKNGSARAMMTSAGEGEIQNAIKQLVLIGQDIDGAPIDIAAVHDFWDALSLDQKTKRLREFVQQVEAHSDTPGWHRLLAIKASIDLKSGYGVLQ